MLRDYDLGAAFVEFSDNGIAVEGFVGEQGTELNAVNQRSDADGVETMAGQQAVRARTLVVIPPLERPMAWREVPLLRPGHGGEP